MADVKASELIQWLKGHLGDGYVYGTVGQICTISLLKAKERQYGKAMGAGYYQRNGDYTKGKCARWLGRWVADCSGLIKAGRKAISGIYRDVSAQGTYEQCSSPNKGKINTMPMVPGCTVYMWSTARKRMGHVGVYIGDGYVIESRGVGEGVVKTSFKSRKWGYWGLLDWLELDLPSEGGGSIPDANASTDEGDGADQLRDDKPCSGIPSLEAIGDSGYNVLLLQQWLNLHGAQPRLAEDAIFGTKTDAAVMAFKQARNLAADGITCIETWTALIVPPPAVPLTLKTIKKGASGILVTLLQRLLYTAGISPWDIDGRFGSVTETAVRVFQQSHGLVVDGIVGPNTWGELVKEQTGPTIPMTLRKGDRGPDVEQLQRALVNKGIHPGSVDGIFGPRTEAAVQDFQQARALTPDGVVGPDTWALLEKEEPPVPFTTSQGDTGPDVELLQNQLIANGFSPGAVDGIFGPKTQAAVKAYQKTNGLEVDGIVGPVTWGRLLYT